jgi:nitroimidazol reductase NimA-like FMN-containing flavoprotein (pyridoxamine 5'-phosphate oxidase superfamily)
MSTPDSYPITQRNRLRQLGEKGGYDRAIVHGILDSAFVAHVGLVQDDAPVVVPMIYGRDGETLYLHGARKARVIRLLEAGGQACVNVTLVDGLVVARSAFNSSVNYRSVTLFGAPRLVMDRSETLRALEIISEQALPGRWAELRAPTERELKMTGVIALGIDTASAKVSAGMPDDDEADYAQPVWAGVLPLEIRFTALEADDRLPAGTEPSAAMRALEGKRL